MSCERMYLVIHLALYSSSILVSVTHTLNCKSTSHFGSYAYLWRVTRGARYINCYTCMYNLLSVLHIILYTHIQVVSPIINEECGENGSRRLSEKDCRQGLATGIVLHS